MKRLIVMSTLFALVLLGAPLEISAAKVGQPAPDFTAHTSDGKPFKLSTVLGKKPILIYFTGFDG